jgi:hypothetical protein
MQFDYRNFLVPGFFGGGTSGPAEQADILQWLTGTDGGTAVDKIGTLTLPTITASTTITQVDLDILDAVAVGSVSAVTSWHPKTSEASSRGVYTAVSDTLQHNGTAWVYSVATFDTWTLTSTQTFPDKTGWPVSGSNGYPPIDLRYYSSWITAAGAYAAFTIADQLAHYSTNGKNNLWVKPVAGDIYECVQYKQSKGFYPGQVAANEAYFGGTSAALCDVNGEYVTDSDGYVIFTN